MNGGILCAATNTSCQECSSIEHINTHNIIISVVYRNLNLFERNPDININGVFLFMATNTSCQECSSTEYINTHNIIN